MTGGAEVQAVRGALGLSFAHRYVEAGLRFALLVVLARLIEPAGFGAFAVATAIASLLTLLCRSGPAAWIVRSEAAEPALRTPATLALLACLTASAALWTAADPIASLVGLPRAAPLLSFYALGLLLLPLDIVFGALLRRRLAFGRLAVIGIGAVASGGVVAVALAVRGGQETALVAGAVTESAVLSLGYLFAGRGDVLLLRRTGGSMRDVFVFSGRIGGGNLLADLGRLVAPIVIGASLSAAAAGLFDRAWRVVMIFGDLVMNALRPVVLPSLAAARRADAPLADAYLFKIAALSVLAWPFFLGLAIAAEPVVMLLLGDEWTAAVPLVRLACLFGIALPFYETDNAFLIATGRERDLLRIQAAAQIVALTGLSLGAQFGVGHALIGLAAGQLVRAVLSSLVLGQAFGVTVGRQLAAARASAGVTVLVGAAAFGCVSLGRPNGAVEALLVTALAGLVGAAVLVGSVLVFRHPVRSELVRLLRDGAQLRRRARRGG